MHLVYYRYEILHYLWSHQCKIWVEYHRQALCPYMYPMGIVQKSHREISDFSEFSFIRQNCQPLSVQIYFFMGSMFILKTPAASVSASSVKSQFWTLEVNFKVIFTHRSDRPSPLVGLSSCRKMPQKPVGGVRQVMLLHLSLFSIFIAAGCSVS